MPSPCAGRRGFIQKGSWAEAGHSFALGLKGSAPGVLPASSEQTEEARGQLDSVRLIIVAGSSRLVPRDAKGEGTGKGQKLQPLGHVLLWESRLPFKCEKYPSIAVVLRTSVEMVLENTGRVALTEAYGLPLSLKEKRTSLLS